MASDKLFQEKKRYVVGIYDHEEKVVNAVKKVQIDGVKVDEVYSPHPIHHIDTYIGHSRTRLPVAAFMFAITGTILAILMITYMMKVDWPMIIGGKNSLYPPTMVPVTFEATVLIAAFGMVFTFLVAYKMGPGKKEFMFDRRTTDDKYALVVDLERNNKTLEQIQEILVKYGAEASPKVVEKQL